MPDKIQICENCKNPFVYSEYEQKINLNRHLPDPHYCPICTSLKASEKLHPPKPKN